jgi:hypothetical protein
MRYTRPEVLVAMTATKSIAQFGGGGQKGPTTCYDSSSEIHKSSSGAYELDE